ncbi:hypothetical protein BDA99DRAFT_541481 [Phascolomyces articulosus]|uniref:Uncharacterized protein n=1 Tax=Phascolomyces articulosus TaxID=60185 RepID=A0AAD5JRU9_9FUNG|nr:hypothetical protein BDA99DRAFT_541481 [Phascolomyces articulosus]
MLGLVTSNCGHHTETIRSLRMVGFVQFYLQMNVLVLDCPAGYVCRLRRTDTYAISTRPSMMTTSLIPILSLTWKAKIYKADRDRRTPRHEYNPTWSTWILSVSSTHFQY